MRTKALSPKPGGCLMSTPSGTAAQTQHVHVSQRMGNSLCSHPALFMSSFGITAGSVSKRVVDRLGGGQEVQSKRKVAIALVALAKKRCL